MEVVICKNAEDVAQRGADCCCQFFRKNPSGVLGLATGSTPLALYEELIHRNQDGHISFKDIKTFNLDEYIGLRHDHPQSYHYFMHRNFFDHIDIRPFNIHIPDGSRENPMEVGPEYEALIKFHGGIDLQILGLGRNGHIGFNEPTSSLSSRTRTKTLTPMTIQDNSRFFEPGDFQPTHAIALGIQTILEAKRILMLVTGESKAQAVKQAIEGPLTSMCPASALQLHNNSTVLLDEAAASLLEMKDYYHFVLEFQDALIKRFGDPRY